MSILSVQSHVTRGHVGNSAAVFVLQSMGHDVWPVHTVQLSNHPGYPHVGGAVTPAKQLNDIFSGLQKNGWFEACNAILGGYMGSHENGRATLDAVARIKACRPDVLYICDPVIGDTPEGIYVSKQLVSFYRSDAISVADVVIPNLFELGILTQLAPKSIDEICTAARLLISQGPELVLVTSVLSPTQASLIGTLAVSAETSWIIWTPCVAMHAKGAGDVFAALWTGHRLRGESPEVAMQLAVSGVAQLIEVAASEGGTELPLVNYAQEIIAPLNRFELSRVERAK